MSKKTVVTSIPNCDLCAVLRLPTQAYADCYIPSWSTWGNVCLYHFNKESCQLGTGKGQQFELQEPNHTPQSQTERIKSNIGQLTDQDFANMSYGDFEELFEDRDPMEFL